MTITGTVLGTPHYMAPEQALGQTRGLTKAVDVYALGVILYQLLTGRLPFDGDTPLKVMRSLLEDEPPKPREFGRPVDRDLETICLKCLEKEPARRYASAEALADRLERWLRHEPIPERPIGAFGQLRKWVQRKPVIASLTGTLVVVGLLSLGAVFWQYRVAVGAVVVEKAARASAQRALAQMRIRTAEEYFTDNTSIALAYLACVLRADPSNFVAGERLLSALTHHNFALPSTPALRHQAPVNTVRFSPDGALVVTASDDGTAQVWSTSTGDRRGPALRHQGPVLSAEFSPDGTRVLTASKDGTARLWKLNDAESPVTLQHSNVVHGARFSANGRLLATASEDGTAVVWDVATGRAKHGPFRHNGGVFLAQFSPEANYLLTASYADSTARLWTVATGAALTEPLEHGNRVVAADFSPDSRQFVTASWDHDACIRETSTGNLLYRIGGRPKAHTAALRSVCFSPDGRWLLTAAMDGRAKVWDAKTGEFVAEITMRGSAVAHAQFSPDAKWFVTASVQGSARVWETSTGVPVTEPLPHQDEVRFVSFGPKGDRVASASADGTAQVWDLLSRRVPGMSFSHNSNDQTNPVSDAAFSPDGQRVLSASRDGTARIWDAVSGKLLVGPLEHPGAVMCARFSSDSQLIATGCEGQARVWDSHTGQRVGPPLSYRGVVLTVQFSLDSRELLTSGTVDFVKVWEIGTSNVLQAPWTETGDSASAAFSPDERRFIAASDGLTTRIYDLPSGRPTAAQPLQHREKISAVCFAPNGNAVATASWDGTARVWDALTGVSRTLPLHHQGAVFTVQFSPDSRAAITASYDATARIWDVTSGRPLADPLRHRAPVLSAEFSTRRPPRGHCVGRPNGPRLGRPHRLGRD